MVYILTVLKAAVFLTPYLPVTDFSGQSAPGQGAWEGNEDERD